MERIIQLYPRHQFEARHLGQTYIYAIGDGEYVKFGQAWNVSKRLKSLQTGSPRKLEQLAVILAPRFLEKAVHDHLRACRTYGEWFRLCDESRAVIGLMKPGSLKALVDLIDPEQPGPPAMSFDTATTRKPRWCPGLTPDVASFNFVQLRPSEPL